MKNINILLFLSDYKNLASETYPRGAKEEKYTLENSERIFKGIQTNDVPIQYMFEQAKNVHGYIKRVLCIKSYMVSSEPKGNSQFNRFKIFVNNLADNFDMPEPDYISIPYDYDEASKRKTDFGNELPVIIYNRLAECFESVDEGEEVYIDYTGGLRDISFLMTSIIRFLEFRGIVCGEIVYSNLFSKKLCDIHYIYDIYQIINGVNEFTNTGNARELVSAYGSSIGGSSTRRVVEELIGFSDALSICDIGQLDDKVNKLIDAITELENSDEKEINSAMLKTLAPIIRKKMYLDKGFNYPKMIRWCAENNMIQQAATIYTDKMPKYYFESNLVPNFVNLQSITPSPGHNLYDTGFYTELFDRVAEGIEIDQFRQSLKKIPLSFDGSMNRGNIISAIQSEKTSASRNLETAYNRIIDFINRCYEQNSLIKKNGVSYSIYHIWKYQPDDNSRNADGYTMDNGKIPYKLGDFWRALISENAYWPHRFLYNDESSYLKIATPKKRKTDKTLRKKAFAIQRIKNKSVSVGCGFDAEKTFKIMAYYLAVKMMRNRMNHAGENIRTIDEKEAIDILNQLDIGINFCDNVNSYRDILLKGIEI